MLNTFSTEQLSFFKIRGVSIFSKTFEAIKIFDPGGGESDKFPYGIRYSK